MRTIFGQDRRYIVPLFQRPYVWTHEDQWAPLWDDVSKVAERVLDGNAVRSHFLGAIVLDHMTRPTGHLETRLVIDGQQRLTTIQLLLEAFADIAKADEADRHFRALLKLTRNDDPMSDDEDEQFKVWPTNADQEDFRQVILAETPNELKEMYGRTRRARWVGQPMGDAYLFFHERVTDWLRDGDSELEERLDALYGAVRDHLRMVVIDLGPEDDAQLIFETLNARGTPLLPSDLVKNYLFHQAQRRGVEIDPLYRRSWAYFDDDNDYWREEITRGRTRRARLDVFLQHFLTMKTRDDVLVSYLYKSFQEYSAGADSGTAEDQLADLKHFGEIFHSFDTQPEDSRAALFFRRLGLMDTTTAYPFLLDLFHRHADDLELVEQILVDVESFLVRRLVCQLTTKNYNRIFVDLIGVLDRAGDSPFEAVRDHLLEAEGDSVRWPRDAELRRAWLEVPAFRALVRRRTRMLLEAVESELFTEYTERVQLKDKLTVEHLMPQDWRKHWPLPETEEPEEAEEEREALLHTLGNLTLLTKKLNPSVSNGPWEKKRPAILKHSALSLNRQLQDWEGWDEEAIRERGAQLFEVAREIWACPEQ